MDRFGFNREFLHIIIAGIIRQARWQNRFFAYGICIHAGNAKQVAIDKHGKAATQRLGNVAHGSSRHGQFIAGGNHYDSTVAFELAGLAGVTKHELATSTHLGLKVVLDAHFVDQGQLCFQPVNVFFLGG